MYYRIGSVAFIVFTLSYVLAQNTTEEQNLNDDSQSYCLRFTWLGPNFNNESSFNTTCALLLEEKRAVNTPCRQPLVVSYNGSYPDISYMWENHRNRVACRMSRGQVCAKYSYFYNNEVQNVTFMCTKVTAVGEGAITSGCYKQSKNGYDVEVCVCESSKGLYLPCNSSDKQKLSFITFIICLFSIITIMSSVFN